MEFLETKRLRELKAENIRLKKLLRKVPSTTLPSKEIVSEK